MCKSAEWKMGELRERLHRAEEDIRVLVWTIEDICGFLEREGYEKQASMVMDAVNRFREVGDE